MLPDTSAALQDLVAQLGLEGAGPPDFVTLHYGGGRPAQEVCTQAAEAFSAAALHGGSSCLGVMTEQGAAIAQGDAIGAFAIWDAQGAYGTGTCPLGEDPRAAAAQATRAALQDAGRMGEAPDLVWLTAAPGHEEQVLLGIKDVIGCPALIVGGSSADNDVSGGWSQITAQGALTNSVVVSVLFPSVQIGCSFESGYAPTEKSGVM
ncbi:MAG: FIST N-terminal domain-containing protein [Roseinatronobacter sp.]